MTKTKDQTVSAKVPKKKKAAAKSVAVNSIVIAYKGFDKDMRCRNFQFAVGETYTHKGNVEACSSGFHACEYPLDVFRYYGLQNGNQFAVVEQSGKIARHKDDSKIASERITIKAKIGIAGLVKAAIEWTKEKAKATSGNYAHSATSGNSANSATSGYSAHSQSKGRNGVAANAGNGLARAGEGGAIFIVERDEELNILSVFASKVGDNGIEPDVWYALRAGKPVKAQP